MMRNFKPSRRRGTTLIEMMIAAGFLSLVIAALTGMQLTGSRSFRTGSVRSELEQRARRTMDRLASEMSISSAASLSAFPGAPPWDDAVTFDQIDSVASSNASITWSTSRIEFAYAPDEVNDGVDNNGNGLVDEGRVRLIRNWNTATEQSVILCTGVREFFEGENFNGLDDNGNLLADERGLNFERDGDSLTIRLTLEALDADGRSVMRSSETTIFLRN